MDISSAMTIILFLLQTSIGAPANAFILMAYAQIAYTEKDLRPIDIILCHLVFVNILRLLTRGMPQIMYYFRLYNILDDAGCKLVNYTHRTSRGVSICLTSFLSVYQASALSPSSPRWLYLKSRAQKYYIHYILIFWLFNMLLYVSTITNVFALKNGTSPTFQFNNGVCYATYVDSRFYLCYILIFNGHDVFFVGLMLSSSVYILYVLKRHREQVKYIHSTRQNSKETAERRAAKNVIQLVFLYAFFYGADICFMIYTSPFSTIPSHINEIRLVISSCFAFLSPFLIVSFNRKIESYMLIFNGHDVFFVGLMLSSSVYILYVLKRHREQVKYIHSTRQNSKETAERRAAKNVIQLVSLYAFFYGVDICFMVYTSRFSTIPSHINEIRLVISSLFAFLSPFLIVSFNRKIESKFRCCLKSRDK
uniref:Olfactory receptor class A-like protein 1 n=1 Tax=Geotrypetes seraphini TaxID=260995 RepID=A0A6P8PIL4_GEOSA|nr:olfactory receptor class A-like protein 1 [Geotrypetes seraphini]